MHIEHLVAANIPRTFPPLQPRLTQPVGENDRRDLQSHSMRIVCLVALKILGILFFLQPRLIQAAGEITAGDLQCSRVCIVCPMAPKILGLTFLLLLLEEQIVESQLLAGWI